MVNIPNIQYLTIHCSATPEGRDVKAEQINAWDRAKFGQTSYHWVIELDGSKHRGLQDGVRGAHVAKHNTGNIGICYAGGVGKDGKTVKDTRTEAQKKSLRELVAQYTEMYPILLTKGPDGRPRIRGHRDWSPDVNHNGKLDTFEWLKGCPCFDVETEL